MKQHIVAEVGLTYKSKQPVSELPQITDPDTAAAFLRPLFDSDTIELQEQFIILLLNSHKKCLGWSTISKGSSTATVVEPKLIFQIALKTTAHSLILAHNHPGGVLRASTADIGLTKRLKQAGETLGIGIDDHIILTSEGYLSMKMRGLF
jgi:DNA repair protein RadC